MSAVSVDLIKKVRNCFWDDYDLDDRDYEEIVEGFRHGEDLNPRHFARVALNPNLSPRDLILLLDGDLTRLASLLRAIPPQRLAHLERRWRLLVDLLADGDEEVAGTAWMSW